MQRWIFILPILFTPIFAEAQVSYGLEFDDIQYKNSQIQATLLRGDFTPLPSSASVKKYCPKPLSQRMENTSVGWAVSYGARTILEAKRRGLTNQLDIREISFSPVFNYAFARPREAIDCGMSVKFPDVLESLKHDGVPRYVDFRKSCPFSYPDEVMVKAAENKIADYFRVFDIDDTPDEKVEKVKRSLSKESPVIIGMYVPKSFEFVKDKFWVPREKLDTETQPGQAMVVIGYDDEKYGGAFEVMNSWGTTWANEGFLWIRYEDFSEFVKYGFELFVFPFTNPDAVDLAGKIEVSLMAGGTMTFTLNNEEKGSYKSNEYYTDKDGFQLLVSSMESAFVYVVGSDDEEGIYPLFPDPEVGSSAALPYKNSNVILPSESGSWELDGVPGNGYLSIIFSKEELWLDQIEEQLNSIKGISFIQKLDKIFEGRIIGKENVTFNNKSIGFEAKSKGKVLTILNLEIQHH